MTAIQWRAMGPGLLVGLLAVALGAGSSEAAAQERGGAVVGYVGAGVTGMDTGELDGRLAANGYPTFGATATGVAIGAYLLLETGVMLGGEWHGLITSEQAYEGREVGLGGGYGTLGLGYMREISPRVRVYPRLGIGGGGMGLWIVRAGEEVGFDEVLTNPDLYAHPDGASGGRNETVMTREGPVVDIGGGAELLPGGLARGLMLGVRLGYLAAPFGSDWRLDGRAVTDGPAATIAGPYFRLIVGGGPRW